MSPKRLDPSHLRKISVTVVAVVGTLALFVVLFGASYILFPPSNNDASTSGPAPASVQQSLNQSADKLADNYTKHFHAALMMFVNGALQDFSAQKYQDQDLRIHFENGDGFTLHKHDRSSWLGPFLESLNMTLANNCLTVANGSSYCGNFDNQIRFFVNGASNSDFQHYSPRDEDRILISYGKDSDVEAQLDQLNATPIRQ
jgi:hypothetical protein